MKFPDADTIVRSNADELRAALTELSSRARSLHGLLSWAVRLNEDNGSVTDWNSWAREAEEALELSVPESAELAVAEALAGGRATQVGDSDVTPVPEASPAPPKKKAKQANP